MADARIVFAGRVDVTVDGRTAGEICIAADRPAVAVRVDGTLRDLTYRPTDGQVVDPVPADSDDGRQVLRHSAAHVLAQAVLDLFPDAKYAIGPPVAAGFYYDFDVPRPFDPAETQRIETRMREIVAAGQPFRRRVLPPTDARRLFRDQPYKLEIIDRAASGATEGAESLDASGAEITVYDNLAGDRVVFTDLCRGPHLRSTGDIPAFQLTHTAAAYWRGDERNRQLQRIYGTAWESPAALDRHLRLVEEAERRDHRRLGAELDLFSFPDELGSGLAVLHPRGAAIRRVMEEYSYDRHQLAGYAFVNSPHIAKSTLFETSGHLRWFADSMYPPMSVEGVEYYLKPMNCPYHILVYRARGRSYRELPLRLFEFGGVYRFEKSGVVHGLTRVRGMTQDDAHIFCTTEQMSEELAGLLRFVLRLLGDFGLTEFDLELSTRPEGKAAGTEDEWAQATEALRQVASAAGLRLTLDEGGGAFYGPKISVQARDAIGRSWQMSTIQLDFQLPRQFGLSYQAADNSRQRPVMIHRALFGSVERFLAILLEHYAGAFPPWLAPVQVTAIPVGTRHVGYLDGVVHRLRELRLRAQVDDSDERMQKKIVKAQHEKVPFMLIAGDRDVAAGAVSFRYRSGRERRGVPVDDAVDEIRRVVADRLADPGGHAGPEPG